MPILNILLLLSLLNMLMLLSILTRLGLSDLTILAIVWLRRDHSCGLYRTWLYVASLRLRLCLLLHRSGSRSCVHHGDPTRLLHVARLLWLRLHSLRSVLSRTVSSIVVRCHRRNSGGCGRGSVDGGGCDPYPRHTSPLFHACHTQDGSNRADDDHTANDHPVDRNSGYRPTRCRGVPRPAYIHARVAVKKAGIPAPACTLHPC
mmetsp:Transcript_13109/g.34280  ORF Transcript_13109/g.34280 Transcript_13109/m.34280 type:complete len:204 (-) Transcript_13109:917-1528(-)